MDETPLFAAFQSWSNMDYSQFAQHWIGPQCTLVNYVLQHQGSLEVFLAAADANGNTGKSVIESVLAGTASDDEGRVANLLTDLQEPDPKTHSVGMILKSAEVERQRVERQFQRRQVRSLLRGFIYAALAADAFHRKLDGFSENARQACQEFATAWPIAENQCLTAGTPLAGGTAALQNPPPVTKRLHSELVGKAGYEPSISSWLTVRRLIAYMVGETELPANNRSENPLEPFEVETRVLYAVDVRKQGQLVPAGIVKPLQVRSSAEGPAGCYFDPVALGITRIDRNMLGSVELAWRRIQPELTPRLALRMVPNLPPKDPREPNTTTRIGSLEGGSAGGIFVCAMYAAATRTELNTDATTSICLKLPEDLAGSTGGLLALDIGVVGENTIAAKLDAAQSAGLIRVVLHQDQTGNGGKPVTVPANLTVVRASCLEDVYKSLTGNARMERVLRKYSQSVLDRWNQAWTDPDSEESLLYYVPPKYRLLRPNAKRRGAELFIALHQGASLDPSEKAVAGNHEEINHDNEEQRLTDLLTKGGMRLCISEGPGAGKTIFTRRLQAFLSDEPGQKAIGDGRPLLAVRWEETGRDARWPDDFERQLAQNIRKAVQDAGVSETPEEVIEWALQTGRIVFILDAIDQTSDERIVALRDFVRRLTENNWPCRIIITGRPFKIESEQSGLFVPGDWRYGAILPFDLRQQYRYLYGPESDPASTDAWRRRALPEAKIKRLVPRVPPGGNDSAFEQSLRAILPNYSDVQELVGNPNALWMVRSLVERGVPLDFRNRAGLYLQTTRFMLDYAAKKLTVWPTDTIRSAGTSEHAVTDQDIERWESLLAAAAFSMMAKSPEHFRVTGKQAVAEVRRDATARISPPPNVTEWQLIERIAELANRTITYASNVEVLAWPNRRMMEFYCGLHLTKNSQSNWIIDVEGQPLRCGDLALQKHAGDPQWKEPFLFAMELPEQVRDPGHGALRASLAELFQPTAGAATGNRRPTELMFHAWGLLAEPGRVQPHQRELHNLGPSIHDGQRVLQDFQKQFQVLVRGGNPVARQLVAGTLLPNPDGKTRKSLVLCPPQLAPTTADLTFAMGDEDEEKVPVTLSPFWLQSTPVTVEQFALFDGEYRTTQEDRLTSYAPAPTCPAIDVDWRDAFLFSYWVGGRLPTEAEWEYACRAGTTKAYSFEGDESRLGEYAWYHKNSKGKTHPVAGKLPNGWGLYDMHGNVYEWCGDWYAGALPGGDNPVGPATASGRVFRGGSWDVVPQLLRSGFRGRFEPRLRSGDLGFRVARSSVGAQ